MNVHADKTPENKSNAKAFASKKSGSNAGFQWESQRPEASIQREIENTANNSEQVKQLKALQRMAHGSQAVKNLQAVANDNAAYRALQKKTRQEIPLQGKFEPIQKKENKTGLPDHLKAGIETLSGYAMDGVKVHYNSARPAQLNALAYAQGTDIHIAPGQEKHLPHEAWHVVQQAQGRVKPTMQLKEGIPVNDDKNLEQEADVMGARALLAPVQLIAPGDEKMLQGKFYNLQRKGAEEEEMLQGKFHTTQLATEEEEFPLQGKFNAGPAGIQQNIAVPDNPGTNAHMYGCGCKSCMGGREESAQLMSISNNEVIQRAICPQCKNDTLRKDAEEGEVCKSCMKKSSKTSNTRKESGMGKGGEDKRKGRHHRG